MYQVFQQPQMFGVGGVYDLTRSQAGSESKEDFFLYR